MIRNISMGSFERALCKVALIVFIIAISSTSRSQTDPIHVLVLGDWGREGKDFQTKVAEQMTADAKLHPVTCIISTGDNFYETGVISVTDSQWKTSFENIYSDRSLQVPWLVALGNHDYLTNAQAEIEYSAVDKRWVLPSRYFTREYEIDKNTSVTFFIVDTSPFIEAYRKEDNKYHVLSQDTKHQLAWLDSALSHSKSKWKFVVGHHPIYSAAPKHGDTPELIAQMLPILKKNHVQAYLAGHDHNLQHTQLDGMDFYVSGGGSEVRDVSVRDHVKYAQKAAGFLDLSISVESTRATFIDSDGKSCDTSVMNP